MTKLLTSLFFVAYGLAIIVQAAASPVDEVLTNKFVMIALGSLFYHVALLRSAKDKYYDNKGIRFNGRKYFREHWEEWILTVIWAFIVGGNGPQMFAWLSENAPVSLGEWYHIYYLVSGAACDVTYWGGKYGMPKLSRWWRNWNLKEALRKWLQK